MGVRALPQVCAHIFLNRNQYLVPTMLFWVRLVRNLQTSQDLGEVWKNFLISVLYAGRPQHQHTYLYHPFNIIPLKKYETQIKLCAT